MSASLRNGRTAATDATNGAMKNVERILILVSIRKLKRDLDDEYFDHHSGKSTHLYSSSPSTQLCQVE